MSKPYNQLTANHITSITEMMLTELVMIGVGKDTPANLVTFPRLPIVNSEIRESP
jgi:hypothetical protein